MTATKLTSNNLIGNWGTILLPINKDGSIDFSKLNDEIDYLIAAGTDGIYTNGTAGEFYNITEDEYDKISELVAIKCWQKNRLFQLGVSHMSPIITTGRLQRSVALKADALQLILPDWIPLNRQEQDKFMLHMQSLAKDTPLILYNPPHAKSKLGVTDFLRLEALVETLIGIKVADGDAAWYQSMIPVAEKLAIFVPGHHLATGVKMKVAAGAYSNVACLNPRGAQKWWEMMKDDLEEALHIERLIVEFMTTVVVPFQKKGFSNPALDKFLAAIGGWASVGTRLRGPYSSIEMSEVYEARKMAQRILPKFLLTI